MPIDLTGEPEATGAARFRRTVGRTRMYVDFLPACDIAAPTADDEYLPSVTTLLGKAFGSDWSPVACKRIGQRYAGQTITFDADPTVVARELRDINTAGLNAASERGSGVHSIMEAALGGPVPLFVNPDAEAYRGACEAWLDEYQPEVEALEFVCFNRTLHDVGYAGTCDAMLRINGQRYLVDWKSRGNGHTVYDKEAAQLGGYALADYWVEADGTTRRRLPDLAGGLVVSICVDGVRTYPVELDAGSDSFTEAAFWATRDHRAAIGKAWGTVKAPEPPPPHKATADAFNRAREVENRARTIELEDADAADPDAVAHLVALVKQSPAKHHVNRWALEAATPWHKADTLRRWEILRAAHWCALLEERHPGVIKAQLLPCFETPDAPIGQQLADLTTSEAVRLADMAQHGLDGTDPATAVA